MTRRLNWGVVLCVLACVLAGRVAAQQGISIAGVVKDAAGAVLPGVKVDVSSPVLPEGNRTAVTDVHGAYRVGDLRPGVYVVTFRRDGFVTARCDGLELAPATTVPLSPVLAVGDTDQITNVTPERAAGGQGLVPREVTSREQMDTLPTDRTYISFAAMTPGMQIVGGGGRSVGGSLPESAQMLQIHGSRVNESRLFVDGMSVMSGNGTGGLNLGNFLNNAMAQAVVVNTGVISAEFEVGGVTSNVVSRDGANTFRGAFTGRYTTGAAQDSNLSQDLRDAGLTSANRIQKIWDLNPAVGGPLVKDRLWWLASLRHWGTYNYVAGLYDDVDPTALFYTPDFTRPALYPVRHLSADAKLTMRLTRQHRISAFHHHQLSDFGTCTSPAPTRQTAPSACAHFKNDPQWFSQASWSSPLSSRVTIEAGATVTFQDAAGRRDPGVSTLPAITESGTRFSWRAPTGGFGGTRNSQSNYRAALSYVTASHTIKAGFTLQRQWRVTGIEHNDALNYTFRAQTPGVLESAVPVSLTQFAEPATYSERVNYNLGLYAEDQWRLPRVTLTVGVRGDFFNAQVDAQHLPAGPFVPERHFEAIKDVPDWRDLSPRLGAAYQPFASGKTTIRATLGRYVLGEAYSIARDVNPLESTTISTTRTWNDFFYSEPDARRGNFTPDCDLRIVAANGECLAADADTFGQRVVTTRYDPAVTRGFGVRPYNWVAGLSIDRELTRGVTLSAGYVRRWFGNFNTIRQNNAVTNADFDAFCVIAPKHAQLPDGGGYKICGLWDVSVAKFGATDVKITSNTRYGKHEEVFDGFDFTINARLRRAVTVSGGVGFGRQRTNTCYATGDLSLTFSPTSPTVLSPRTAAFCDVHPPMRPNLKVQGIASLPWWDLQVAATFQSLPGPQLLAPWTVSSTQIQPALGRHLSSCGNASTCGANVTIDLIPPGTQYGDRLNQIDVRLSKRLRIGRTTVRPTISVYNLLNANPVLQYGNRFVATAPWPAPTAILTARFADIGVQIDF